MNNTVVDGFTITAGNAVGVGFVYRGGGINEIAASNAAVFVADSDLGDGCLIGFGCSRLVDADPQLGTAARYFGSTLAARPAFGSPVIDAANDATCEPIDQRGTLRPQHAHCDMGAVEMRYPSDDIEYPKGF
ncbi:MAG: choice-of-anchor Q domain-containing protein [Rudaea sp.]